MLVYVNHWSLVRVINYRDLECIGVFTTRDKRGKRKSQKRMAAVHAGFIDFLELEQFAHGDYWAAVFRFSE